MTGKITVKGNLYNEDGTWIVRARVYDPLTNKTKHRSKTTGMKVKDNTKRKAEQIMRAIVEQWEAEANSEVVSSNPLFSEYVKKWLAQQELYVRKNTYVSYRGYANLHIIPELGSFQVRDIRISHLNNFYKSLLNSVSVNSVRKYRVVISGALHLAVQDNVIPYNIDREIKLPHAAKFEGKAYNAEQVSMLLTAARKEGEPVHSAIILGACYGLRRSEICGLRWKDIDFNSNVLHVRNTLTQNGKLFLEGEHTKTAKSRRDITLLGSTVPYFKELRESQIKNGIQSDKVCVWPDGRAVLPNYLTHRIPALTKKYGLERVRLHDLRHTAATLLGTKATPKQVQAFLGHEDVTTTLNIYTHLQKSEQEKASGIMNEILEKSVFCSGSCSESSSTATTKSEISSEQKEK